MSMLFLPCCDCGAALVARTRIDRSTARCGKCTSSRLTIPDVVGHDKRLELHVQRMEAIRELCADADIDISKAGANMVDRVVSCVSSG